jgi:benzoyl-CoA reductase/2-hydroxyglutaryl-CoA dehydratase subunit BcrC/BadD/HgdB
MPATIAVENLQYDSRMHEKSREIMNRWYANLKRAAANNEPSAALMISGNCVEILWAFDIHPIFPEVNALQLAIRKKSLPFILKAEEIGYSGDNCAYVKADIGYMLSGGSALKARFRSRRFCFAILSAVMCISSGLSMWRTFWASRW